MFVFDEVDYAKDMLKNGFKKAEYMQNIELMILAKYLFSIGKDEKEVRYDIDSFCEQHRKYFNTYLFDNMLNSIVKRASKSNIRTGKIIHITKSEIDIIIHRTKELKEKKLVFMKVAFVMLFLSKVYSDGVIRANRFEIFKMANVKVSEMRKMEIFQELTGVGLINYKTSRGRDKTSGYIVCFADDKISEKDYIYNNVDSLDKKLIKILNEYKKGDKDKYCENCGLLIVKINNKTKYCSECKREKELEKYKKYNKRRKLTTNRKPTKALII